MKFLVVGLGSMGKRRVRNLKEIGIKDIVGYDIRQDRMQQAAELYSIKISQDIESALKEKPDAMIISTSPDAHKKYALIAAENEIHFFTEVNTMEPRDMQQIIEQTKNKNIVGIPSSNLMFHPSIIKIKDILKRKKIGKILTFNFHSGAYLPDWHPWEKLEDYYVFDKDTGGGRDQIMWELSWIYSILGIPKTISGFTRKIGDFKANIFDVYNLIIEFSNDVLANIVVDVIQRPQGRSCEIIGEKGTIKWNYEQKTVKFFSVENNEWKEFPESVDYKGYNIEKVKSGFAIKDAGMTESYIDEIKNFINIIEGKQKAEFTFKDEKILLEIMFKAEESSKNGINVRF